jgi:phosphopantothenoylcysteine synthetase/decarboxylase
MNTLMWSNPFSSRHINELKSLGIIIVDPISKKLMCGDTGTCIIGLRDTVPATNCTCSVGVGAMANVSTIVAAVREATEAQK